MIALQEYLNNKYPTLEEKEAVAEIIVAEISQMLEGGELDLREFKNLKKLVIDQQYLKTPLTKLNVEGLVHLKELDWIEKPQESEEEKKLYEELAIADNPIRKKLVQEVQRLANLKSIKVNFKEKEDGSIFLELEKKDKQGNFAPSLVFWNLAYELAVQTVGGEDKDKTLDFWKDFKEQRTWIKDNINEAYSARFNQLLNPATFPTELLEIKDFYQVYFPESKDGSTQVNTDLDQGLIDKMWQNTSQELMKLTEEEFKQDSTDEKKTLLTIRLMIANYDANQQTYSFQVDFEGQNPLKEKITELVHQTALKLENENLKEKQSQTQTEIEELKKVKEDTEIVAKKYELLSQRLQDYISEEEWKKIEQELSNIQ